MFLHFSAAIAFEHPFDTKEISGLALSPDGERLVIAFSKSERGSFVVVSKDAAFETYRKLALPEGHIWRTPSFAPDGSYIALASLCRPLNGCKGQEGWNIWRYDLATDQARQMTKTRQDVIKWRPFVAANDDIYFVAMGDVGSVVKSQIISAAHISLVNSNLQERDVFPTENPYAYYKSLERYALRYRGIRWSSIEIGFADTDQIIFSSIASNAISERVLDRLARGRRVAITAETEDQRVREFASEMRARWPENHQNKSGQRIFKVTAEKIELVEVEDPENSLIGEFSIYPLTSYAGGNGLLLQAAERGTRTKTLWTLTGGRLEKLFRSGQRGVTTQYVSASDDLGVVAVTVRTFIDGNFKVGERVNAPLVIVRDRDRIESFATILIEQE